MILVAIILLLAYFVLMVYTFMAISRGKLENVLLYAIIFFPIYSLFLSFTYQEIESPILAKIIQYSKEAVVFSALMIWIYGQKNVWNRQWHITILDSCFLAFLGLTLLFFVLGIGDATVVNRAIYVKNILVICLFYFFGRNVKINFSQWNRMFQIIFVITILACVLVTIEKVAGTHFHNYAGYAKYNLDIKGEEPTGIFGLAWTFEAQGGRPRYGAFFAHPLELSASMLITTSACLIYLLFVPFKMNKYKYLGILFCAFLCVVFAYSRASYVAFFMMLAFMALLLRYYRLLLTALGIFVVMGAYIVFFASDEIRYFVIDTLTFQNSSSMTHIVDWLNAVNSIISDPQGIGLAMSGNAGGVEKDLIVGGENQFLVYAVQLGVIGGLLYIAMLYFGIRNAWRAFRLAENRQDSIVPFIAAAVKFGLILPLFTANAEVYIYVCLVSWWFIGHAETCYQTRKRAVLQYKMRLNAASL